MKNLLKKKLFGLFVLLFCILFVSQDAGQLENQLMSLSSTIKQELSNLKTQTALLQNDLDNTIALLQERSQDLRLSESERLALETQRTELLTSLENMNERYNSLYNSYVQTAAKLEREQKTTRILLIILLAWTGLKVLRIIIGCIWPVVNKFIPWIIDVII